MRGVIDDWLSRAKVYTPAADPAAAIRAAVAGNAATTPEPVKPDTMAGADRLPDVA